MDSASFIDPESTPQFRRSSFCGAGGCVEVAALPDENIGLRDAKDLRSDAPVLRFTKDEWTAFLNGVNSGEFSIEALGLNP